MERGGESSVAAAQDLSVLASTICQPQPIRRAPILIGGSGEKNELDGCLRTLDRCAALDHSSTA